MTKEDYYNICGRDGDLNIPRTYRTYFDRLCHEYSCYPVKQKKCRLRSSATCHGASGHCNTSGATTRNATP